MAAGELVTRLSQRFDAVEVRAELPGGKLLPLLVPRDEDELCDVLALARAERLALAPTGLGSKATWCHPAEHIDALVSTRQLTGVLDYEPGDGTLTARAGTRMDALIERAASGGHSLTPDVALPAECTLGGVVAAGQSGFDRLLRGPLRHHVLGMRVMLADGTSPKSGGKLVKNVTGYDLHRLYTGSFGTLCVILDVSLRLFPLADREVCFRASAKGEQDALETCDTLLALPLPFTAVLAEEDAEHRWRVSAFLAGRPIPVDAQADELARAFPGAERRDGDAARALRLAARDRERERGAWAHLSVTSLPSRMAAALAGLRSALETRGHTARVRVHPGIASAELWLDPAPTEATGRFLAEYLAHDTSGARVRWLAAPAEWGPRRPSLDRFGPSPAGLERMRRLQTTLDPDGLFARGRFAGGL